MTEADALVVAHVLAIFGSAFLFGRVAGMVLHRIAQGNPISGQGVNHEKP